MNGVIYARVSSVGERQSTERQVKDLSDYAKANGITICQTFEEHISGAKKNVDRHVLNDCFDYCLNNYIDIILISELSRLGRNVDEVLANIRWLKDHHINVFLQKENISIYDRDGNENPFLTIMIAVLGTCSQIERENIKFRLNSGRKLFVEKNLKEFGHSGLGRKAGSVKSKEKKLEEYKDVLKLLRKGYPTRTIAKITGVSRSTVQRLQKEFKL